MMKIFLSQATPLVSPNPGVSITLTHVCFSWERLLTMSSWGMWYTVTDEVIEEA